MSNSNSKRFSRLLGYDLNLENPQTFNEKLQWIKFYGNLEKYSNYVDKYEVRHYVREKIGDQYLVPIIGVFNNVNEINFDLLPNSFVLKATHGSGWNIFVEDKSIFNFDEHKEKLERWLNSNFYDRELEPQYKPLKGRLIIEEFINNNKNKDFVDLKINCFNGKPKYIQVHERRPKHKCDIFDLDWNKLPLKKDHPNFTKIISKPKNLEKIIEVASILSFNFPYVRVDLYTTNNRIYFSELTFVPRSGFNHFDPFEYDKEFGKHIDLEGYVK